MNLTTALMWGRQRWPGLKAWCKDEQHIGWLWNWFAVPLCIVLGTRLFWYHGDWLSLVMCVIAAITLVMCGVEVRDRPWDDSTGKRKIRKTRALLVLCYTAVACSVLLKPDALGVGYWVDAANGQTTLTRSTLLMPPWPQPVYYVPQEFDESVTLTVTTKDRLPLSCHVAEQGVELDRRDTPGLERFLLGVAATRDPQTYLGSKVIAALANSAWPVFKAKTAEQIKQQGQFLIPYRIGTPMGDMLARNHLHWSNGEVSVNCTLARFQN